MVAPLHLEDVLEANRALTIEGLHTCEPARVLSYNAAKQTIDAQPVNKRRYTDADTGQDFFEEKPAIPSVPVGWPMAGGYGLCMPLEAGDHVWLIYAQDSISEWREANQTSEPTDAGRLTDSHPFAIPSAFAVGKEFAQTTKAGSYFGHKSGNGLHVQSTEAELKVGPSTLTITSSGADLIAAAVKLGAAAQTGVVTMTNLTPFMTALSTFVGLLVAQTGALTVFANDPLATMLPPTKVALLAAHGAVTAGGPALIAAASAPTNYSSTVKASP
jgi:Phage protein Gp138 N-terminal domain